MENIGTYIIYIIMFCAFLGAVSYVFNPESELGKEFLEGIYSIGPIFVPVAGIMASIPYLSMFIENYVGPVFSVIGADPSIAGTTFIAADMGGYQLSKLLSQSNESWIVATLIGFTSGATIIFSIPVGLSMLQKSDHKYMALGVMAGIVSIPFSIAISVFVIDFLGLSIRSEVDTLGQSSYPLNFNLFDVVSDMLPLVLFCATLAFLLKFFSAYMIRIFLLFGKVLYSTITLVLVFSIIEYFTSFFSIFFGGWGFSPIIADEVDQFRALEVAGYIGIMLSGTFPLVYLMNKYLSKYLEVIGSKVGLSSSGTSAILAASANILAMFRLVATLPERDKVIVIAFSVCAAFTFGDHLAFSANFQPTLIVAIICGKLGGGVIAFCIAKRISLPKV